MATWLTTQTRKSSGFLLALPAIFWLGLFFILPLIFVFVISFMSRGSSGAAALPFTTEQYERVFTVYGGILKDSVWIAFVTTVICLAAGYPLAFYIKTRRTSFARQFALFMVILPFWTNFLVRTYAWRMLLGREGTINSILLDLGLVDRPLPLLGTSGAVMLGLVYGFLPFMVLPIYASVERFDFRMAEAAADLGANAWNTFWRVVFPMTLPGVIAGCILVFVPSIGTFVTADLLGGRQGQMIGSSISEQFLGSGNMPLGAALSTVMMSMVITSLIVYARFADGKKGK